MTTAQPSDDQTGREPIAELATSDCSICRHPDAAMIDAGLLAGTPIRTLAGTFSLSRSSVGRHRQNHLSADAAVTGSDDVLTRPRSQIRIVDVHGDLVSLADRLENVVELATRTRKAPAAVAAMRELRQTLIAIADLQANPELHRAASKQDLEEWVSKLGVDTLVAMLGYVLAPFGYEGMHSGASARSRVIGHLVGGCLHLIHERGVEALSGFAGVDTSEARAFVEREALERARRVEEEVQRRVEAELRRREAAARPALEARQRPAIEGSVPTWSV